MTDSNKVESLNVDNQETERRICPGRLKISELIYTVIGMAIVVGICAIAIIILTLKNMNKGVKSINPNNWKYDSESGVYYQLKLSYLYIPKDEKCQKMAIFVPKDYMDCKEKSGGKYHCQVKKDAKINNYTPESAPIIVEATSSNFAHTEALSVFPSSKSSEIKKYAESGFIYVYPGLRGAKHGVPGGVVDLKSSIIYTKVNANKNIIPGNSSRVFAFGEGAGGELATMVGITGDSEDYDYYLQLAGSITNTTDSVLGAIVWNPITNMDYGDSAYEWNMGLTRESSAYNLTISKALAVSYASVINYLKFNYDSYFLTLEQSDDGYYQNGTYYEYIKAVIENSFNNYLQDSEFPLTIEGKTFQDEQEYVDYLNSDIDFLSYDNDTKTGTISDVASFAKVCKKATRGLGAYDDIDKKNAENQLFGLDGKYTHFDDILGSIIGKSKQFADEIADADDLGYTVENRRNLYSPFYWLNSGFYGYNSTTICKYWRIRSGLFSTETPLNTEANLYLALNQLLGSTNIDFETVWEQGFELAERTGSAAENMATWIDSVLAKEV